MTQKRATEYVTHPALERLPNEPTLWHDRFVRYALLNPERRSLLAVYRAGVRKGEGESDRKDPTTIKRAPPKWAENAKKWRWAERVAEYDDYNRRQRITLEEQERRKMLERHIQIAHAAQTKALLWLKDGAKNLSDPSDVARFIDLSVKIERQARGLPGEMLEMLQMSDEQLLSRYASLMARLQGGENVEDEETNITPREQVKVSR